MFGYFGFIWRVTLTLAAIAGLVVPVALATEIPFASDAVILSNGVTPTSVHPVDFDRDGDIDVIASFQADNRIAVAINDGATPPAFAQGTINLNAVTAQSVASGDLDGDGDLDIVSASAGDNEITWYRRSAGGGYTAIVITNQALSARWVDTADVDGDGDLDILSASATDDTIAWYDNDGAAAPTFTERIISTSADFASSVHTGDFDRDGDLDVVSASNLDGKVSWYRNDGGSPPTWFEDVVFTGLSALKAVRAADVDGDGDLDIVSGGQAVIWWRNDGSPGTALFNPFTIFNGSNADEIDVKDMDGDGDMDVIDETAWYENTNLSWTRRIVGTGSSQAIAAADLDDDGDLDLIRTGTFVEWNENLTIHRNAVFPVHRIIGSIDAPIGLHVADLDSNGTLDVLAASSGSSDALTEYESDGFAPPAWTPQTVDNGILHGVSCDAGDIDGDGDLDVLVTAADDDRIIYARNDGGNPTSWTTKDLHDTALNVWAARFVDLDRDGDMDVIYASRDNDTIGWIEQTAPSTWAFHVVSTLENGADDVRAADIDADGDLDLVSVAPFEDTVAWHENQGGSWVSRNIATSNDFATSVIAVDVNEDGHLDVVAASADDDTLAWYENDGASPPGWTERIASDTADGATTVVAADLDRDGDLDLATAWFQGGSIAWHENDGSAPANFGQHVIASGLNLGREVRAADMDEDGDLDLVFTSQGADQVAWRENRGGQYAFSGTDLAPAFASQGDDFVALEIELKHNGRAGDTELEWATMELLFEESPGNPLSGAESDDLFVQVAIYLDNGSGAFEASSDEFITNFSASVLTNGVASIPFNDGDPDLQALAGVTNTYWIVVELENDAASQSPNQFVITHLADGGSLVQDEDFNIPLQPENPTNLTTGVVVAALDSDGDGSPDPLDVDDDNDGTEDGQDCLPLDGTAWEIPSEVGLMLLDHDHQAGESTLLWNIPSVVGGTSVFYDVLTSKFRDNFLTSGGCVVTDVNQNSAIDDFTPDSNNGVVYFLARAGNACGEGTSGTDSMGGTRPVQSCP